MKKLRDLQSRIRIGQKSEHGDTGSSQMRVKIEAQGQGS